MADIRNTSEMVMFFDGVGKFNMQTSNANRLNARHNKQKNTNLLMFDGHAESIRTENIPGGMAAVNGGSGSFSAANLKGKPPPYWRLDQ